MAVTIKDLARAIGVSDATVSMALRGNPRISAGRRRQITKLAEDLGYQPNAVARAMRLRKTNTVGLLMGDFRTGISNLKAEAIEQELVASGYQVLIGFTHGDPLRAIAYVGNMAARQVDGMVILALEWSPQWPILEQRLRELPVPCVLVDVAFDAPFASVKVDRADGMAQVARHLMDLGHREILYLGAGRSEWPEKWAGLAATVATRPDVHLRWASAHECGWHDTRPATPAARAKPPLDGSDPLANSQAVHEKARELVAWRPTPTAVVLPSDSLVPPFVTGLRHCGRRVPEDVSVTGFDDADELRFFEPATTSVRQPRAEVGQKAVALLHRLMQGGASEQIRLRPELLVRASTAAPTIGGLDVLRDP